MARQNVNEPTTSPPSHIPPFARSLAPYIKSRQEALRIRQVLTSYLRSHITYADNDHDQPRSHLSLSVPSEAVAGVKRIPSEFTGLRRQYLQALQANIAARREYQTISEKAATGGPSSAGAESELSPKDSSLELQSYLRLVRDRRRHAKLQVFEHYLRELRQRDAAKPEDFEGQEEGRGQQVPLPEEFGDEQPGGSRRGGDIEGLLQNLERAVIRAKSQLDKEKTLLEELKAKSESQGGSRTSEILSAVRAAALQRTRDELVQWVEEKLVSGANNDEEPVQELPPEEIEESARILADQKARIMEQYAAYADARKCLLDTASRACQPTLLASSKPPERSPEVGKPTTEEALSIEPLEALSFATDILHPLSKTQRSLALQKFYLSGLLTKEKSMTLRILRRLSDESHLLPEYPILARQPRFKHAAAAISSRNAASQAEPTKPDEIVTLAEAWAFASQAAGSGENEYVEKNVAEGGKSVEAAQLVLQKVYDLLNQDLEETLQGDQGEKQDTRDIWASEAQSTRSRMRAPRAERRSKGPWTHLNGRVGRTDERIL